MKKEQLNRDSKKYFLSTDLYDNKDTTLGAICVWTTTEHGGFDLVHSKTVRSKEFAKEVERIAKYYNTTVIYETEN